MVVGEDPEHGEGDGHLWSIDPTRHLDGADVSNELVVNLQGEPVVLRHSITRELAASES